MANPTIPQELLREYFECEYRLEAVRREKADARLKIVALVHQGARAERGPLGYAVIQTESRLVRRRDLIEAIAPDEYENLLAAVEPVIRERLTVYDVAATVTTQ